MTSGGIRLQLIVCLCTLGNTSLSLLGLMESLILTMWQWCHHQHSEQLRSVIMTTDNGQLCFFVFHLLRASSTVLSSIWGFPNCLNGIPGYWFACALGDVSCFHSTSEAPLLLPIGPVPHVVALRETGEWIRGQSPFYHMGKVRWSYCEHIIATKHIGSRKVSEIEREAFRARLDSFQTSPLIILTGMNWCNLTPHR